MKSLPTVFLVVVLAISLGLPVLVVSSGVFFPMSGGDFAYLAGKYFGLSAFLILTFQYLWTAKFRFMERIRSYDGRVAVHRTLGFLGILVLGLHPILILGTYAAWSYPLEVTVPMGLGFVALVFLLLIAGSTFLGRIWRIRYENWKKLHWFTFPVLTMAFFHSLRLGSDLYGPYVVVWFIIWGLHLAMLLGKIIHKIRTWARTLKVVRVEHHGPSTTTLVLEKPRGRVLPGQFSFISLRRNDRWQSWHPFSLTSHPREDNLSVTIKGLGDFTNGVSETKAGDPVKVDQGYGAFSPLVFPDTRYVMIAGGVGITPVYGILKELKDRDSPPEVVLIYCAHHDSDFLFKDEMDGWFDAIPQWKAHYVCSSQPDWEGPKGRLTPELAQQLLEDNYVGTYFLCGPVAMVAAMVEWLRSKGVPKRRIRREQFVFLP